MERHELAARLDTLLLPRLGRELPRALRRRDRARRAGRGDRARRRRGTAADPADAAARLPVPDAWAGWRTLARSTRRRSRSRACRAARICSRGRCSRSPGRATSRATSMAPIRAGEESVRIGGRLSGGTMPSAGGGPGWALAVAFFALGEHERARRMMHDVGGEALENWIPVERFFNWENVVLERIAAGDLEAADAFAARGGGARRRRSTCGCRSCLSARARADVQLARGDAANAARAAERSVAAGEALGAKLQGAFSRSLLGHRARGGRRPRRRGRGAPRRPSASSTRAARCASASRRGASCAGSARASRRAARRRPRTPAWARSRSASARSAS